MGIFLIHYLNSLSRSVLEINFKKIQFYFFYEWLNIINFYLLLICDNNTVTRK